MRICQILLAASLLAVLALPFGLAESWSAWQILRAKKAAKLELKQGLSPSEVVLFELTPSEARKLDWKHKGEFCFGGEWYDVIRTEIRDGRVLYYCFHDVRESELHRNSSVIAQRRLANLPKQCSPNALLLDIIRGLYTGETSRSIGQAPELLISHTPTVMSFHDSVIVRALFRPPLKA